MPVSPASLQAVRSSPLLEELDDAELERMAAAMETVTFPKGEPLFEQDTEGQALYVIGKGQVGVVRRSVKEKTRERLLAVVGPGECVGEMALADGGPRSASIVALEDVEAFALCLEPYKAMRDSDPALAIKVSLGIFRLLSKRLRQINKSLEVVHYWMFA
ncbi:MAG: cyclic nucleotide-binding domain-containing protein [Candidatus Coatesbacteria bacterium]